MTERQGMDRRTLLQRAGTIGTVAGFASLAELLAACGTKSTTSTSGTSTGAKRGGSAVLAIVDTPVNLDPADAQLYSSMQVYQNIFSRLLEVGPNFDFEPSLAHTWTQEDGKTWTVNLVDNAVFHNGQPVTAEDVKFSFDRIPTHGNGVFVAAFKQTEVLGKHKVRFHLRDDYGPFLATLATVSEVVNKKAVTSMDPKLHPIGCGPYKLKEWVKDDHVTLERWDKYFVKDRPYLDQAVFRSVSDDTVRLTGLQTGDYDWIQRVPLQRVSELESSSDIVHTTAKPFLPDLILLNCSKPPFDDVRVRQAIAWLVDRDEISKLVWFGQAPPATEAVSKPSPWFTGENPYAGGPDPEKAKQLLKQAGQENLHITFAAQPNVPTQARMGEVLKSQLAKGGVTMTIQNYAAAQWFEQIATKKYDLTITLWSATVDPAQFYYPVIHSNSSWNFPYFSDKRVDQALDRFVYQTDDKKRKTAYHDVVRLVAEQSPVIFLVNELQEYWTVPSLQGAEVVPSIEVRVEKMWRKS